jgi:hypothetical protein
VIVWLASYPRSGNTFFRVILNHVFAVKTFSIYNDTGDIGADDATSDIVGHCFLPREFDLEVARSSEEIYFIKTHELLENMTLDESDKVIYLIRDGRESSLSFAKHLKNFYGKSDDLDDVLWGDTPYGSWGEHVRQWQNVDKMLLIRFEELTENPTTFIHQISDYIAMSPVGEKIPTFEELHAINPKFFRSGKKDSWRSCYSESEHLLFWLRNYQQMFDFGYMSHMPQEVSEPSFERYLALFEQCMMDKKTMNQEQKVLNERLAHLKNAIKDVAKISLVHTPLKKYQQYKELLKTYKSI